MIAPYTQESLSALSWDEVRSIHAALGLKATAKSRTRRDYENRILAIQSQKVEQSIAQDKVEAEQVAATPVAKVEIEVLIAPVVENNESDLEIVEHVATLMTCATCPLAEKLPPLACDVERAKHFGIEIENHRYLCPVNNVFGEVVQGWWQAKDAYSTNWCGEHEIDCYAEVARRIQSEIKVTGSAVELKRLIAQQPIAPQLEPESELPNTPAPTALPKIWDKVTKDVAIGEFIRMPYHPVWVVADKKELSDGRTRLVVRTPAGSQTEQWYFSAPAPSVQPAERVWSLDEIEDAIASLKDDILNPKKLLDRPIRSESTDRETITWKTPFQGEILGREGKRPFFIEGDCIYVVLQSGANCFCASERKHPNYHHVVIRQAIEAGKTFDPSSKIGEPCRFGRIHQSCDGWWWIWGYGETQGHKFFTRPMALKYLEMKNVEAGDRVAVAAGC